LPSAPGEHMSGADDAPSASQPVDSGSIGGGGTTASASSNGAATPVAAIGDAGSSSSSSISGASPKAGQDDAAAAAVSDGSADEEREWDRLDGNQLHTALSAAVHAEDYGRAQRERPLLPAFSCPTRFAGSISQKV